MFVNGVLVRGRCQKTFKVDVNYVRYGEFFLCVLIGEGRVFLLGKCNDLWFVDGALGIWLSKQCSYAKQWRQYVHTNARQ